MASASRLVQKVQQITPTVINLSNTKLSDIEIKILDKGLKFTPTPEKNSEELKNDIKQFCRKLRLSEEFYSPEDDEEDPRDLPLVRNKSRYNGRRNRDRTLDTYIDFLETFQIDDTTAKRSNLNQREREAIKSLTSKKDIVITSADKGGAVVVLSRDYYRLKMEELLNNTEQYKVANSDSDSKTFKMIKTFVDNHSEELLDKEYDYLTNFDYKQANFYGLAKIHKSNIIKEAVKTQKSRYVEVENCNDVLFRPICGSPFCVTSRLSNLLDIILKPLCLKVTSYIKDTTNFMNKLERKFESNSTLVLWCSKFVQ